jgi:chaperonin cofactor prefoldin
MASEVPKSLELETRVSRLEILVNDLRNAMDLLNKRTNAIQAQLDHLDGRIGRV